jgi:hypothetical protein
MLSYKLGFFLGRLLNLAVLVYLGYDAYVNISNGDSAVFDIIALLIFGLYSNISERLQALNYGLGLFLQMMMQEEQPPVKDDLSDFEKLLNDFGSREWNLSKDDD